MISNRTGVIMTVTAFPARKGTPLNGGYGAAMAAKEALTRDLSAEFATHGIRVLALRPNGMAETSTMRELFEIRARASGMTWEQFEGFLASMTPPATGHDARGDGQRGGLHGIRQSQRDDGNHRQPDHGDPR
jgi:NAD(P)-dependent dehydrogenase (short-subunit alcohol dehydrogenase family)